MGAKSVKWTVRHTVVPVCSGYLSKPEQRNVTLGAGCAGCSDCSGHFGLSRARGLWHGWPRGRDKKDMDSITVKNNRNNRNNRNNPMDMRGLAVPIRNDESEQVELKRNTAPWWPVVERACLIVNDGLSHAISPPVALRALPNGSGSPITPLSNQFHSWPNAPEPGSKSGVVKGQPVEPLDSKPLSALGPQSMGLVALLESMNGMTSNPNTFRTANEQRVSIERGSTPGGRGPFLRGRVSKRYPRVPCSSNSLFLENFYRRFHNPHTTKGGHSGARRSLSRNCRG